MVQLLNTKIAILFCLLLLPDKIITHKQVTTNFSESSFVVNPPIDPELLSYKFAIIWPKGYIKEYKNRPEPENLPDHFTIHGLWAIDRSPSKEPSPLEFDAAVLSNIMEDMVEKWPDVKNYATKDPDYTNFWSHEWNSHGRKDPIYKNHMYYYFVHTINLFTYIDATRIIIEKSGRPNTLETLRRALLDNNMRMPFLVCVTDGPNVYLSEIHFCMDWTAYTFEDCLVPKDPKTLLAKDCREGVPFLYSCVDCAFE